MADQIGMVIHSKDDGWARVVTDRKGACGGCQSTGSSCRSCLTSAKLESRVINIVAIVTTANSSAKQSPASCCG